MKNIKLKKILNEAPISPQNYKDALKRFKIASEDLLNQTNYNSVKAELHKVAKELKKT